MDGATEESLSGVVRLTAACQHALNPVNTRHVMLNMMDDRDRDEHVLSLQTAREDFTVKLNATELQLQRKKKKKNFSTHLQP